VIGRKRVIGPATPRRGRISAAQKSSGVKLHRLTQISCRGLTAPCEITHLSSSTGLPLFCSATGHRLNSALICVVLPRRISGLRIFYLCLASADPMLCPALSPCQARLSHLRKSAFICGWSALFRVSFYCVLCVLLRLFILCIGRFGFFFLHLQPLRLKNPLCLIY